MCGNGIFSTSQWKVIQHKRAFLGEPPEPKLRPCSRNENKISYRQITKTVSIGLNIHQAETLNTKQKKIMVRNVLYIYRRLCKATEIFLRIENVLFI